MAEGFSSGVRATRFLGLLPVYPPETIGLIAIRVVVGVLEFASGWMLMGRRPFGRTLAIVSLLASAGLGTLEVGFNLAPTRIFPAYRWPTVIGYWAYAIAAVWAIRKSSSFDFRSSI